MGLLLLLALAGCSQAAPDSSQRPVVTIAAAADAVVAGDPLRFLISAAPAPQANLTVGVTIASARCELTGPPDSVPIGAGKSQATLAVETSGVAVGAQGCVVTATIAAGDGYAVGEGAAAAARATLTRRPVVITATAGDSPVIEGNPVSFTLTAAPAPIADLTVNVSWSDPGSFLAASGSGTVTIRPSAPTATLTADTDDDGTDEQDGSVTVTVDPGSGYTVGTRKSATVTVTDNDSTTRSPGPTTPGPTTPAPTTPGPAAPAPTTPTPRTPTPAPEDTPPMPTVTISAPGATPHYLFSHAIKASVNEGDTMSFTLEAAPAPESALTVTLGWTFGGEIVDPPEDTDLKLTPRPEAVTIPTSGSATFTLTAGNNNKENSIWSRELISIWPGDGYTYDVPYKLFVDIEDDE